MCSDSNNITGLQLPVKSIRTPCPPQCGSDFADLREGSDSITKSDDSCDSPIMRSSMRRIQSCLSVSTLAASLIPLHDVPKTKKKMTKQVSFHNLQIREYDVVLGDNPSCRYGPPVEIGWDYSEANEIRLDDIITENSNEKKTRKLLDANVRYDMVRGAGYTDSDILKSMRDAHIIKKQRHKSINNEKYDKINERIENISRKFKKIGKEKKKDKVAPKLSRSVSLNSLALRLPRRNSLQNFQKACNVKDPLAVSRHDTTKADTVESTSNSLEKAIDENTNESALSTNSMESVRNTLGNSIHGNTIHEAQNEINENEDEWGFFDIDAEN